MPFNDKVDVEIYRRKFTIEMEGLTQLELNAVAEKVDGLMREIEKEQKIYDSSKLAILAALEIAADLQRLQARMEDLEKTESHKIDDMTLQLEKSLESE